MNIVIAIPTWPNHTKRIEYLSRTLDSLKANLTASHDTLTYLVSAETERDPACKWCGDELTWLCGSHNIPLHWRSEPASLGGSMNTAARLAVAPPYSARCYVIWQDDFVLLEPLDLSPIAAFLCRHPEVAMHRISYFTCPVNGTKFKNEIEPGFRLVDIDGPWGYGDDPAERFATFEDEYGPYLEGGRHGMSESEMLLRLVKQRAVITAGDRSFCGHIGSVAAVPESKEFRERAEKR